MTRKEVGEVENPRKKPTPNKAWARSLMGAGWYISADDRLTAELRPAGYYPEFGCKLVRHYAIRHKGHEQIIGTALTLAEATRIYGARR